MYNKLLFGLTYLSVSILIALPIIFVYNPHETVGIIKGIGVLVLVPILGAIITGFLDEKLKNVNDQKRIRKKLVVL